MARDEDERAALLRDGERGYGATSATADSAEEAPAPAPAPKVESQAKPFREVWPCFLGLATAVFCAALSATIVANIQIDIASYFRAGSLSSWLGTGFLLGLTAMTPLYGRLAQVLGRKGAMMLALLLFTILCAIAPSMYFVLGARVVAGAGSGGLLTVTVRTMPRCSGNPHRAGALTPGNHHHRPRIDRRPRAVPGRRQRAVRRGQRDGRRRRRLGRRPLGLARRLLDDGPAYAPRYRPHHVDRQRAAPQIRPHDLAAVRAHRLGRLGPARPLHLGADHRVVAHHVVGLRAHPPARPRPRRGRRRLGAAVRARRGARRPADHAARRPVQGPGRARAARLCAQPGHGVQSALLPARLPPRRPRPQRVRDGHAARAVVDRGLGLVALRGLAHAPLQGVQVVPGGRVVHPVAADALDPLRLGPRHVGPPALDRDGDRLDRRRRAHHVAADLARRLRRPDPVVARNLGVLPLPRARPGLRRLALGRRAAARPPPRARRPHPRRQRARPRARHHRGARARHAHARRRHARRRPHGLPRERRRRLCAMRSRRRRAHRALHRCARPATLRRAHQGGIDVD